MVAALFLAVALDAFLGIFIAQQQLRTAADAAALASTSAIAALMPDAVEQEAAQRVQDLLSDERANEEIDEEIEELDEAEEACAANPLCTPMTAAERAEAIKRIKVRAYRRAFSRLYRGSLAEPMAEMIVEGTWSLEEPQVKRDELIPDNSDLGCLIQETAHAQRVAVLGEAERLAQANGAELEWASSSLIDGQGRNRVVVSRRVKPFGAAWIFPDGNYPKLSIPNAVALKQIGHRTAQYSPSC